MMQETRTTYDPNYKSIIDSLQHHLKDNAMAIACGLPPQWFRPEQLTTIEDEQVIYQLFVPEQINQQLIESFNNKRIKAGDIVNSSIQTNVLSTIYNTFIDRHTSKLELIISNAGVIDKVAQVLPAAYNDPVIDTQVFTNLQ